VSDFIELVFTYVSGLTSHLNWGTVKFAAGAIALLWVGLTTDVWGSSRVSPLW
jgi:hypothetical protein